MPSFLPARICSIGIVFTYKSDFPKLSARVVWKYKVLWEGVMGWPRGTADLSNGGNPPPTHTHNFLLSSYIHSCLRWTIPGESSWFVDEQESNIHVLEQWYENDVELFMEQHCLLLHYNSPTFWVLVNGRPCQNAKGRKIWMLCNETRKLSVNIKSRLKNCKCRHCIDCVQQLRREQGRRFF